MQAFTFYFYIMKMLVLYNSFYYNDISYMTDGSGIDHREYNKSNEKPTVWAKKPGVCVGFFFWRNL